MAHITIRKKSLQARRLRLLVCSSNEKREGEEGAAPKKSG